MKIKIPIIFHCAEGYTSGNVVCISRRNSLSSLLSRQRLVGIGKSKFCGDLLHDLKDSSCSIVGTGDHYVAFYNTLLNTYNLYYHYNLIVLENQCSILLFVLEMFLRQCERSEQSINDPFLSDPLLIYV